MDYREPLRNCQGCVKIKMYKGVATRQHIMEYWLYTQPRNNENSEMDSFLFLQRYL